MRGLLLAVTSVAMLASGQVLAEPIQLFPPGNRQAAAQPLPPGDPDWFFGDGGFECAPWWCGDPPRPLNRPTNLARQTPRLVDPSEGWFFGDGGFDCPAWRCGQYRD